MIKMGEGDLRSGVSISVAPAAIPLLCHHRKNRTKMFSLSLLQRYSFPCSSQHLFSCSQRRLEICDDNHPSDSDHLLASVISRIGCTSRTVLKSHRGLEPTRLTGLRVPLTSQCRLPTRHTFKPAALVLYPTHPSATVPGRVHVECDVSLRRWRCTFNDRGLSRYPTTAVKDPCVVSYAGHESGWCVTPSPCTRYHWSPQTHAWLVHPF